MDITKISRTGWASGPVQDVPIIGLPRGFTSGAVQVEEGAHGLRRGGGNERPPRPRLKNGRTLFLVTMRIRNTDWQDDCTIVGYLEVLGRRQ